MVSKNLERVNENDRFKMTALEYSTIDIVPRTPSLVYYMQHRVIKVHINPVRRGPGLIDRVVFPIPALPWMTTSVF